MQVLIGWKSEIISYIGSDRIEHPFSLLIYGQDQEKRKMCLFLGFPWQMQAHTKPDGIGAKMASVKWGDWLDWPIPFSVVV